MLKQNKMLITITVLLTAEHTYKMHQWRRSMQGLPESNPDWLSRVETKAVFWIWHCSESGTLDLSTWPKSTWQWEDTFLRCLWLKRMNSIISAESIVEEIARSGSICKLKGLRWSPLNSISPACQGCFGFAETFWFVSQFSCVYLCFYIVWINLENSYNKKAVCAYI